MMHVKYPADTQNAEPSWERSVKGSDVISNGGLKKGLRKQS